MRRHYLDGGYGYGHAKKELLEVLIDHFAEPRRMFQSLMADRADLDRLLRAGAGKARQVANATLDRVRSRCGYLTRH
jgi:tryptophanyl-tRNA synthetase